MKSIKKKLIICVLSIASNTIFAAAGPPIGDEQSAFERYEKIKSPIRKMRPVSVELINRTPEKLHLIFKTIDGKKHKTVLAPSPEPQEIEFPNIPFENLKTMEIRGKGRTKKIPANDLKKSHTYIIHRPALIPAGINRFGEATSEILSPDYQLFSGSTPRIPERRSPIRLTGSDGRERHALEIPRHRQPIRPAPSDIKSPMIKAETLSFFNDTNEELMATFVTTGGSIRALLSADRVRQDVPLFSIPTESIERIEISGTAPQALIIEKEIRRGATRISQIYPNLGYWITRLTITEPGDRDSQGRLTHPRKADSYTVIKVTDPYNFKLFGGPEKSRSITPVFTETSESSLSSESTPEASPSLITPSPTPLNN